MRLISYRFNGESHWGVMADDTRFDPLSERQPGLPRSLRALLEAGDDALQKVRTLASARRRDRHRHAGRRRQPSYAAGLDAARGSGDGGDLGHRHARKRHRGRVKGSGR